MNHDICLLITLLHGHDLVRVALKCEHTKLPPDPFDCTCQAEYDDKVAERRAAIRALLPFHCQNLGPIVQVETIFEISDLTPREEGDPK